MAAADTDRIVDAAIRRTLDAPELQFRLYSVRTWSDSDSSGNQAGGWSGDQVEGWWRRDESELFTTTTHCGGKGSFEPDWERSTRDEPALLSLIQGSQRRTWERTWPLIAGALSAGQSCLHRIEGAPSAVGDLVETWRKVIRENIAYDLTVPMPEITPMESLTALCDDGFALADLPAQFQAPNLYKIRHSGALRANRWRSPRGLWRGYLWLDDDGFVRALQLYFRETTIFSSIGHDQLPEPTNNVLAEVPAPVDLDSLVAVGSEVLMPAHPYDIDPDVFGELDDFFDPHHPGCYPNFWILVKGAANDSDAITDALIRAAARIKEVTWFGRELTSDTERELCEEFGIYTPEYVADPTLGDGGIDLYSDWDSEILPDVSNTCLAIVVHELLTAGVTHARMSRATRWRIVGASIT